MYPGDGGQSASAECQLDGSTDKGGYCTRPVHPFRTRKIFLSAFSEFILLSEQCFGVKMNTRPIVEFALEGEDVRDHLVLCVGRDHGR